MWQTPKTDWSPHNGVMASDFNRIEVNSLYLFNSLTIGGNIDSKYGSMQYSATDSPALTGGANLKLAAGDKVYLRSWQHGCATEPPNSLRNFEFFVWVSPQVSNQSDASIWPFSSGVANAPPSTNINLTGVGNYMSVDFGDYNNVTAPQLLFEAQSTGYANIFVGVAGVWGDMFASCPVSVATIVVMQATNA